MLNKNKFPIIAISALLVFGASVWGATHFQQVKASISNAYFDMGGKRIYNVGAPQGATEAATQAYVLSAGGALKFPDGAWGGGCKSDSTAVWPATYCMTSGGGQTFYFPAGCASGWTSVQPDSVAVAETRCICTTAGGCASL